MDSMTGFQRVVVGLAAVAVAPPSILPRHGTFSALSLWRRKPLLRARGKFPSEPLL